jgi:hypothetical protein
VFVTDGVGVFVGVLVTVKVGVCVGAGPTKFIHLILSGIAKPL